MRLIDADALADYFDALVGWSIPLSDVVNVIENWPDHLAAPAPAEGGDHD